jgi:hypothetical protein
MNILSLPQRNGDIMKKVDCIKTCISILGLIIVATFCLASCLPQQGSTSEAKSTENVGVQTETPPATSLAEPLPISTKSPPPVDWQFRWVRGIPCSPPCWEGITPGKTLVHRAAEILSENPLIYTVTVKTNHLPPETGFVIWKWAAEPVYQGGQAEFDLHAPTQTITNIQPYYRVDFRLGDIIQAYGAPDFIFARAYRENNLERAYSLRVVYLTKGFLLSNREISKPTLNVDTLLSDVYFYIPTMDGLESVLSGLSYHPEWLIPWEGMRGFDFYCRDEENKPNCHTGQ